MPPKYSKNSSKATISKDKKKTEDKINKALGTPPQTPQESPTATANDDPSATGFDPSESKEDETFADGQRPDETAETAETPSPHVHEPLTPQSTHNPTADANMTETPSSFHTPTNGRNTLKIQDILPVASSSINSRLQVPASSSSNSLLQVPGAFRPTPTIYSASSAPPPDLSGIHELLSTLKETLTTLGSTFDSLGEQTARISSLGPAIDTDHQLRNLQRQLTAQDRKHEDRVQELKETLQDDFKRQLAMALRARVQEMIRAEVQQKVKARVEVELKKKIPSTLKQQVAEHQMELQDVSKALFNSEARRYNALLRSNHLSDRLRPLLRPNGQACEIFPGSLKALFLIPGDTAKRLVQEYDIPHADNDPREKNLNRFMSYIGVSFQMVPAPGSQVNQRPLIAIA